MDAHWDELSVGVIKLSLKMELATTNLSKIAHLEFKKKTHINLLAYIVDIAKVWIRDIEIWGSERNKCSPGSFLHSWSKNLPLSSQWSRMKVQTGVRASHRRSPGKWNERTQISSCANSPLSGKTYSGSLASSSNSDTLCDFRILSSAYLR